MTLIDAWKRALAFGAWSEAARLLAKHDSEHPALVDDCIDRILGDTRGGCWLRSDSEHHAFMAERVGADRLLEVSLPPGIYALAVSRDRNTPFTGQKLGALRHITVQPGPTTRTPDEFADTCQAAIDPVLAWLYAKFGPVDCLQDAVHFQLSKVPSMGPDNEDREGSSVGLAACLAAATQVLGSARASAQRVAATGSLRRGQVVPVDDVEVKVRAALREGPGLERIFIPKGQRAEVDSEDLEKARINQVEIVEVATSAEALEHLFPALSEVDLPLLDVCEAAKRCLRREIQQHHLAADALARAVLPQLGAAVNDGFTQDTDALTAWVKATAVVTLNDVHKGDAKTAFSNWDRFKKRLDTLNQPVRDFLDVRCEAVITVARATTLIDTLDFAEAVDICAQFAEAQPTRGLKQRVRLEFLGTWSRALAAHGELEDALALAEEAGAMLLPKDGMAWDCQRRCNHLDILCRLHARSGGDHLETAQSVLDVARTHNEQAVANERARDKNRMFLDLWQAKIWALEGNASQAEALIAPPSDPGSGHFPTHHLHRFVGEALEKAGQTDAALARLDAAARTIGAPGFAGLILQTAAARAACIRIAHGRDGWRDDAHEFLEAVVDYKPGFATLPDADATPETWAAELDRVLRALPY